jgi:hypothetical protein
LGQPRRALVGQIALAHPLDSPRLPVPPGPRLPGARARGKGSRRTRKSQDRRVRSILGAPERGCKPIPRPATGRPRRFAGHRPVIS